ncbi:MAG: 2'-deoxycytidine 5'-triphosphate deaminase [candidate division Zixibacteria bacterium]|nr:2'-deoxycytidine 5'-triphosphate deaminase [candidate division Zixibacteria bacterium]
MTLKEDEIDNIRPGVLNKKQTELLFKNDIIKNLDGKVDSSSFDLHLSSLGYKMRGSIKPDRYTKVTQIINDYKEQILDLEEKTTLKTGVTYLIQLKEVLRLPKGKKFFGRTTGKSSIGRLDVLTRLIVDECHTYDTIDEEYGGSLFLEVTPITFPIVVKKGIALSQLRLFRGCPEWSEIKNDEIQLFGGIILDEKYEFKKNGNQITELRVNLLPDPSTDLSAFRAKKNNNNKDLEIDLTQKEKYFKPEGFWDGIKVNKGELLEIEKEKFYILRSKERFKLPKDVAVSCQAISETLGELRIHYAGFVHPFFGSKREDGKGTPIIFEVRGHNVTTYLRDGETLANINFYRMSEPAEEPTEKNDYENQELKLSKYFKDWGQT